jgi:hypothetical protein
VVTLKFLLFLSGCWRLPIPHFDTALYIKKMDDWYRVSKSQIVQFGGAVGFLRHMGGLTSALRIAYPQHVWNRIKVEDVNKR